MKESNHSLITDLLVAIALIFIAPALMRLGWNVIAWEFNLPTFSYMDMVCIYLGMNGLASIFHYKVKEK